MIRTLIIAAVAGALAVLVGQVLGARLRWNESARRGLSVVSFLGLFVIGTVLAELFVPTGADKRMEKVLGENSAFRMLESREPAFAAELRAFVEQLDREDMTEEEAYAAGIEWGRTHLAPYVTKYITLTSDSALIGYAASFVEMARHLSREDPRGCVVMLFGADDDSGMPPRLPLPLQASMQAAMQAIFDHAGRDPIVVDSTTGGELLEHLMIRIVAEHGDQMLEDISLLAEPATALAEPARSCQATVALYSSALRMPADSSGTVLRYLLAEQ